WENVVLWLQEREERELFPELRIERLFKSHRRNQLLHAGSAIVKCDRTRSENIPIPQERIDCGILTREICMDHGNRSLPNSALCPATVVTLHGNTQGFVG